MQRVELQWLDTIPPLSTWRHHVTKPLRRFLTFFAYSKGSKLQANGLYRNKEEPVNVKYFKNMTSDYIATLRMTIY